MSDGRGARRLGVAVLAALVAVLATAWVPAYSEPAVYPFSMKYVGSCEGFTEGELRVDGGTVELWGGTGVGGVQKVGSAVREPDGHFVFRLDDVGFTMAGDFVADSVTGNGTYSGLGSSCSFTFTGRLKSSPTTVPATTTTLDESEVDLDVTSSKPLSQGELRSVLRRAGLTDERIGSFIRDVDRRTGFTTQEGGFETGLTQVVVLSQLVGIRSEDRLQFPILQVLVQNAPANCPGCKSPLTRLGRQLSVPDSEATTAFWRTFRLALEMNLP